jgi:hypothetical protein
VKSVATEGGVHGAAVNARVKIQFSFAKRSMFGLVACSQPYTPR